METRWILVHILKDHVSYNSTLQSGFDLESELSMTRRQACSLSTSTSIISVAVVSTSWLCKCLGCCDNSFKLHVGWWVNWSVLPCPMQCHWILFGTLTPYQWKDWEFEWGLQLYPCYHEPWWQSRSQWQLGWVIAPPSNNCQNSHEHQHDCYLLKQQTGLTHWLLQELAYQGWSYRGQELLCSCGWSESGQKPIRIRASRRS